MPLGTPARRMPIPEDIRDFLSDLLGKPVAVSKGQKLSFGDPTRFVTGVYIEDDGTLGGACIADLSLAASAGGDHAVRAYSETFGLPISITNCANNYGAYQFPEKVIPLFTTLALNDEPLPMYASTENRREWIHALDHCRAIARVIDDGREGETYHVGTGEERSVEEIADAILDALGKPKSLKTIVPDRPGHDRRYVLDSSKIARELGWKPEVSFEAGLPETVQWYAENRAWWEPLRGRAPVDESAAWK